MALAEGEYERQGRSGKPAVPEIRLLDFDHDGEEDKDREAVRIFLAENRRVFQYLFTSYATFAAAKGRYVTFDQRKQKYSTLHVLSLQKMLVDHGVTQQVLSQIEVCRETYPSS